MPTCLRSSTKAIKECGRKTLLLRHGIPGREAQAIDEPADLDPLQGEPAPAKWQREEVVPCRLSDRWEMPPRSQAMMPKTVNEFMWIGDIV